MAAFSAGQTLTAADLNAVMPVWWIKSADQNVNNSTTLTPDTELNLPVTANTTYKVDAHILAAEAVGTAMDLKIAWSMPASCILDLAVVGPHTAWNASAANLEVEWSAWQAETGTTTATRSFGSTVSAVFSYHFRGVLRVGASAGFFRLQWAQNTATVGNLAVKAGSSLFLTPAPA